MKEKLVDPEWLTKTAVSILEKDVGSLASNLSELLSKKKDKIVKQVKSIYIKSFNGALAKEGIDRRFSTGELEFVDVLELDIDFPSKFHLYREMYEILTKSPEWKHYKERKIVEEDAIRRHFLRNFSYLFSEKKNEYELLNEYVYMQSRVSSTPEEEVLKHVSGIVAKANETPLPIDNDLVLSDVYITPGVEIKHNNHSEKVFKLDKGGSDNVIELLVDTVNEHTEPIILHGQPGHGKTSSMIMFSAAVLSQNISDPSRYRYPIMVEVKRLGRLDENEIVILQKALPFLYGENFFVGKDIVLIFDGLDERLATVDNDRLLKIFIRKIFDLSKKMNRFDKTKLQVVFTGRTQFVKEIESSFFDKYFVFKINDFDKNDIIGWIEKFNKVKCLEVPVKYEYFAENKLLDLVCQPILLTICSLMYIDDEGGKMLDSYKSKGVRRGDVYELILSWTYMRKWQYLPVNDYIGTEVLYRNFLHMIAHSLFCHKSEDIKISILREFSISYAEFFGLNEAMCLIDRNIDNFLRSIAVTFYFKGIDDCAFEFIHKSIKDFLIASSVCNLVEKFFLNIDLAKFSDGYKVNCDNFFYLLGSSEISGEDHLSFVREIIFKNDLFDAVLLQKLCNLFVKVNEGGLGFLNKFSLFENIFDFHARFIINIFCFICLLQEKVFLAPSSSSVDIFKNDFKLERFLCFANAFSPGFFRRLNFLFVYFDFGSLEIKCTSLHDMVFIKSFFKNAQLGKVSFSGSVFEAGCVFEESFLENVCFDNCKFKEVSFYKCNLSNSSFVSCQFESSHFDECSLVSSNFAKSSFFHSNVDNCECANINLSKVKMQESKFFKCRFDSAYFIKSKFLRVNFLNCEFSDSYLNRSYLFKCDFGYSNLYRVSFRFSELIESDFSSCWIKEASFFRADLSGSIFVLCPVELSPEQLNQIFC